MSDMYDIRDKMYRLIKLGYPLAAIILAVDGVDRNIEYCDLLERVIDIYERRFKPTLKGNYLRDATYLPHYMLTQDSRIKVGKKPPKPFWMWVRKDTLPEILQKNKPEKLTVKEILNYEFRGPIPRWVWLKRNLPE